MNNGIPTITARERPWYPALDGIRGIAILLILLCHQFGFIPFAAYGRTGVDLFFVLSGYLITEILMRTGDQPHYFRNYFGRRVLRIFPLYYGFVTLFFVFARFLPALTDQVLYYRQHAGFVWLHLQNWLYLLHEKPVEPAPLMNHFWSLSLEEQFYLLWPLVLYLFRDKKQLEHILYLFLMASIAARMIAWSAWGDGYRYFYFQSVARLDGFAVGGLIAVWRFTGAAVQRNLIRLILFLVVIEIILLLTGLWVFPGLPHSIISGIALLSAAFGLLIQTAVSKDRTWLQQQLSAPWLRWFGKYAYGIYVFHWPVLVLSRIWLLPFMSRWSMPLLMIQLLHAALITGVTIGISLISYHAFEKRFLALKTRF